MSASPSDPSPTPRAARIQAVAHDWWLRLRPSRTTVDARERWRATLGALLGIAFTGLLSRWLLGTGAALPWLVAPLGASAVLVFVVPSSPLAQPWSVVAGNTVSALVGIACTRAIDDTALAAAVAVSAAIGAMFLLHCIHPPGGATALLVALTHTTQWSFAGTPVLLNSVLLVLAGIAWNSATGRPYPHRLAAPSPGPRARFHKDDLDAALRHYNQVLDVSRDDLETLLASAEAAAYRRHLGEVRCADIMTRDLVTVQFGTSLEEAWSLMRQHRVKALPVTDRTRRIVGIVTQADFMRHAQLDAHTGLAQRLRAFVRRSRRTHSDRPEVVGQIMTRQVRVASASRQIVELAPIFTEGGHHHIPIVEADNRLVGIVTQSDFVRALYRAVQGDAPR
jgi:CBS domain-containing membrane protein